MTRIHGQPPQRTEYGRPAEQETKDEIPRKSAKVVAHIAGNSLQPLSANQETWPAQAPQPLRDAVVHGVVVEIAADQPGEKQTDAAKRAVEKRTTLNQALLASYNFV